MGRKRSATPKPPKPPKAKKTRSRPASAAPTPVDAITHPDARRPNIPTREHTPLVAEDEKAPKAVLYPRDPSLDPQLVWKGKDEQDAKPLQVPAVPIYIQEKIHPQYLIDDLRRRSMEGKPADNLFADFNGLTDDTARTEFYQHDQHWTNRLILGDSLLVMASLAEKERLRGTVQCVYFDPPYGIKFGSNWQVSTRKRDVKDAKAEDLTRQPEQIKAFRDTWELGIHSYLSYMRDRLTAARDLLTESGSIFVQIGDENVHLVRSLMDEVFGSENFVSQIPFTTTSGAGSFAGGTTVIASIASYLLWFAKSKELVKYRELFAGKNFEEGIPSAYNKIELQDGTRRPATDTERAGELPEGARLFALSDLVSQTTRVGQTTVFPVEHKGHTFLPRNGGWKTNREGMQRLLHANRTDSTEQRLGYVRYVDDFPATRLGNVWTDTVSSFMADKTYVVQTNSKVIERCVLMTTDPGDLVLDPTCGSGTTAYVAEQWGRRWITIDTSRVAVALARTRMMAARFPYYLLADSKEGRKKMQELGQSTSDRVLHTNEVTGAKQDIKKGFVYKTVPHVTLKSIANNPDIREGMSRAEIDAAIAKHAETETLYDLPYVDNGIVRVSGPFTVESLSPHRMLPNDQEGAPPPPEPALGMADYTTVILDNLRKAGVQNTKKGERIRFDRLDPYPGKTIAAEGEYTDAEGKSRRVAVCLGPEFGTVGPELVFEAGKEAARNVRHEFDLVLVCGFSFDPHVWEEGKDIEQQIGKMKVLIVRMNPDLSMGDTLLKKTGAGNLFLVFGEPDIRLNKLKDGTFTVTVHGVDVFDPTTGEIRNSGPDEIATWFIDSDYDGRSFFVRHAYFLQGGKDDKGPYDKLKNALRADIDEAEWAKLYSTTSVPFPAPKSGKIAVKVINHYGDEVLKVYTAT